MSRENLERYVKENNDLLIGKMLGGENLPRFINLTCNPVSYPIKVVIVADFFKKLPDLLFLRNINYSIVDIGDPSGFNIVKLSLNNKKEITKFLDILNIYKDILFLYKNKEVTLETFISELLPA